MKAIGYRTLALMLIGVSPLHAQTQVPHVFQSGQPAHAAEVNANFDALESAADDSLSRVSTLEGEVAANTSDIVANANQIQSNTDAIVIGDAALANRLPPIVVDGNGDEIGQLITIGENLWNVMAINQFGYIVNISFQDGALHRDGLVYESADCSGTPYARTWGTFSGLVLISYDSLGNPGLYYVDKTATPVMNLPMCSSSFESGCEISTVCGTETVWPVSRNEPTVTGVTNAAYALPIRVQKGK
jgi:hypothetical protein